MIGFFLSGIPPVIVDMPILIEFNKIFITKYKYEEDPAHDLSSSLFVTANFLGEAIGPVMGGYLSKIKDFEYSCSFTAILNLFCLILFCFFYRKSLFERIMFLKDYYYSSYSSRTEKDIQTTLVSKNTLNLDDKNANVNTAIHRKKSTNLLYMLAVGNHIDNEKSRNKFFYKFNTTKCLKTITNDVHPKSDFE